MNPLTFTTNWNNKLQCKCYSTIRLRNDQRFYVGATFQVSQKNSKGEIINEHTAIVRTCRILLLKDISNAQALIDTGYDADACRAIITKMYQKQQFDWNKQELVFMVLERL